MLAYKKDFLIDAALYRYEALGEERVNQLRPMYDETYEKYGKERFRQLTCLDAEAIRSYKLSRKSSQTQD